MKKSLKVHTKTQVYSVLLTHYYNLNKGNNKITELGTILQRESQNS